MLINDSSEQHLLIQGSSTHEQTIQSNIQGKKIFIDFGFYPLSDSNRDSSRPMFYIHSN